MTPLKTILSTVTGIVWTPLAKVLILAIAALVVLLIGQTLRLQSAHVTIAKLELMPKQAQVESQQHAITTGQEVVREYQVAKLELAAPVERIVTRTIDVCLRAGADRVPVATLSGGNQQGAAVTLPARNDETGKWLQAVSKDLATCVNELTLCGAQYQYHKDTQ